MLQSMIMFVCVRCVFIVTTNCKAMRNNHHEEQGDQETSSHFLFLYYILYCSGPASTLRETEDEKNHLHLVKYHPKKLKELYWACDNAGIILYLIKNQKYTLFYCMKYFSIKRYFIFLAG